MKVLFMYSDFCLFYESFEGANTYMTLPTDLNELYYKIDSLSDPISKNKKCLYIPLKCDV